jgi:hypothetical protein
MCCGTEISVGSAEVVVKELFIAEGMREINNAVGCNRISYNLLQQ